MNKSVQEGFVRSIPEDQKRIRNHFGSLKKEEGKIKVGPIGGASAVLAAIAVTAGVTIFARGGSGEETITIDTPTLSPTSQVPPDEDTPTPTLTPVETLEPTLTLKPAPSEGEPLFDFELPDGTWNDKLDWIEDYRDIGEQNDVLADNNEVEVYVAYPQPGGPEPRLERRVDIRVRDGSLETGEKWARGVCELLGEDGSNNVIPDGGISISGKSIPPGTFYLISNCSK